MQIKTPEALTGLPAFLFASVVAVFLATSKRLLFKRLRLANGPFLNEVKWRYRLLQQHSATGDPIAAVSNSPCEGSLGVLSCQRRFDSDCTENCGDLVISEPAARIDAGTFSAVVLVGLNRVIAVRSVYLPNLYPRS